MALITYKEVMSLLKVKQAMAYKIIQDLNKELNEQGYLTIRGKVEESYLVVWLVKRKHRT